MAINPISTSAQSMVLNAKKTASSESEIKKTAIDPLQTDQDAKYDSFEKSEETTVNPKTTYSKDSVSISEISRSVEEKLAGLRGIVENLFTKQSLKTGESQGLSYDKIMEKYDGKLKSFYQNLEVDDATRLQAQQDISDDGFWGVKQASTRAIEFAIGISGNDPSKLAELKDAIEKGYQAAEKAWGGTLPAISLQTKEATLKGLDEWASGAAQQTANAN